MNRLVSGAVLCLSSLSSLSGFAAPDTVVVFSPTDSEAVKFAASEFVKYAKKLNDSEVILSADELGETKAPTIVVVMLADRDAAPASLRPLTKKLLADVPESEEGFLIHSESAGDRKYLFLIGRSPRAVVYSVYHYLERHCRVGFFKDFVEYVPTGSGLALDDLHESSEPVFPYRGLGISHPDFRGGGASNDLFSLDWRYKKKSNQTGSPNAKILEQRGGFARLSAGPVPFSVAMGYPLATAELFPKGIHSDGFSNWRGGKWYATNLIVDEYEDALKVTRLMFGGIIEKGAPEDSGHLYYFGNIAEAGELNYVAEPMMNATWKLLLEYDPQARMFLESYGSDKVPFLKRPYKMVLWDNQTDDHFLPTRLRNGSTFNSKCGLFGKNWVFCPCLGGGDDWVFTPGIATTTRIVKDMAARPNRKNCVALMIFADAMSHWIFEDLYAQLAWDPRDITLESWMDDFVERRFGKGSARQMAKSLSELVHTLETVRTIGYNNYVFDFWGVFKSDDACWFKTVQRDWWGYIHGQRNYLRLQRTLLLALEEADAQSENLGYDHYMLDVYKLFATDAFKFSLIKMHHHYFAATEAFKRGDDDASVAEDIKGFESNAALCDLVLRTLQDALSTVSIYRMQDRSDPEPVSTERKDGLLKWQNSRQAVFELVGGIYRPRFAVMVDAMRERLKRREIEIIDSRRIHPWYPSPEPYYMHASAKDPEINAKTNKVVSDFVESPVILESFPGSTAESIRAGLRRLDDAGMLYHAGMESLDAIASNFPLSNPPIKPLGYQPVKRNGSTFTFSPLHIGLQAPYNGSGAGHWFDTSEKLEITFKYRGRSRQAVDPSNTLELVIMLDGEQAAKILLDPSRREDPLQIRITHGNDAVQIRHGRKTREEPWSGTRDLCALKIESNYTGVGEPPEVEVFDARVNDDPVPFYTDLWHELPTVEEVEALDRKVTTLRRRVLP